MYLDYDRKGFDVPIVPVQVNSYGSKIIRNRRAINGAGQEPDPSSPTPRRCFEVGQITARILKDSPWSGKTSRWPRSKTQDNKN
jgi:hypothetical protein